MAIIRQDWETALEEGDTGGAVGRGAEGAGSVRAVLISKGGGLP